MLRGIGTHVPKAAADCFGVRPGLTEIPRRGCAAKNAVCSTFAPGMHVAGNRSTP